MNVPCILYVDDKPYHFKDISMMYLYLKTTYKYFRIPNPGEKTLVVRNHAPDQIIYYELDLGDD